MKTSKKPFKLLFIAFLLCAGTLLFSGCDKDDDEDDMKDDNPCEQLECQNGGTAIRDVELGGCRCICPVGFSGENCETQTQ